MSLPVEYIIAAGGKRAATKIIAAANTLDKAGADYVCDGVNDEVEINKGLTDIAGVGGSVLLLEGTYRISASILVPSNAMLFGTGPGTYLDWLGSSSSDGIIHNSDLTNGNSRIVIASLLIDSNGMQAHCIGLRKTNDFMLDSLYLTAVTSGGSAIYLDTCSDGQVASCVGSSVGYGISLKSTSRVVVSGNVLRSGYEGMWVTGSSYACTIIGNTIYNMTIGINIDTLTNYGHVIAGNTVSNCYSAMLMQGQQMLIVGNTLRNSSPNEGLVCSYFSYSAVIANVIDSSGYAGLKMSNASNNLVVGNTVTKSAQYNSSESNIKLQSSSSNNFLVGNICRHVNNGAQYGIDITASTCENNLLAYNDLRASGRSGALHDAGTATKSNLIIAGMAVDDFINLLAAAPDYVHPRVAYDSVVHADVVSPDRPRTVSASLYNAGTANIDTVACTCTVTGIDSRGQTVTDIISIPACVGLVPGGYHTVEGTKAFLKVTQIQFSSVTQPSDAQMCVGIANKLGLSWPVATVHAVKRNRVDETVGAVDTVNNTVACTIAANDNISVYYTFQLVQAQNVI